MAIAGANPDQCGLVSGFFSDSFVVDCYGDDSTLLKRLHTAPPAVLLIDAELKNLDTLDILRQLKKSPELRHVLSIVFVPPDDFELFEKVRRLGAEDVVAKPFDLQDLRVRIEGALSRQRTANEGRLRLGALLVKSGTLTQVQIDQAISQQKLEGGRLGAVLVRLGLLTELQLAEALARQMNIGLVDLQKVAPSASAVGLLPREFIMRHRLLPLKVDDTGNLILAMTNPLDVVIVDEVALRTGKRVVPVMCTESGFDEAITIYLSTRGKLQTIPVAEAAGEEAALALDESIISTVDSLIADASGMRASDIHIEPTAELVRVRCRIDGVLHELRELPLAMHAGIVSRLKIMGSMDIAERRLPQDGRTTFETSSGQEVDLRLASIPSMHGENVSIRLLEVSPTIPSLDDLGLRGAGRARYKEAISTPDGGIVISGPTGTGKSTALYATLAIINQPDRKIYTVEDPIERKIEGIIQTEIKEQIGLTFARALRALVRADPDVIMVGEVRDVETAKMAADSAVTGHLVFTTVHANDAASTVYRLIEMGLPRYVVAAAFRCIVAQRLVRRLCMHCRKQTTIDAERWSQLGLGEAPMPTLPVYEPVGCGRCFGTGYLGRLGLFEVLTFDDGLRDIVTSNGSVTDIRRAAAARGVETVRQDGLSKVVDGTTSYLELLRVTG
jgi:type II secretory ATPase GspE/PulE/Tfp pilus assembly ATPase PilB-like protein/DNA-binding response OmpR family regulator